jgi:hypothetical protein
MGLVPILHLKSLPAMNDLSRSQEWIGGGSLKELFEGLWRVSGVDE